MAIFALLYLIFRLKKPQIQAIFDLFGSFLRQLFDQRLQIFGLTLVPVVVNAADPDGVVAIAVVLADLLLFRRRCSFVGDEGQGVNPLLHADHDVLQKKGSA